MFKALQFLIDGLMNFIDAIASIFSLVVKLITSLLQFLLMIPQYVTMLITSANFLPTFLIPFAVACVSISVVQFILNRKG